MEKCIRCFCIAVGCIACFYTSGYCATDSTQKSNTVSATAAPAQVAPVYPKVYKTSEVQAAVPDTSKKNLAKADTVKPAADTARKNPSQTTVNTPAPKKKISEEDILDEDVLLPEKGEVAPVKKQAEVKPVGDTAVKQAVIKPSVDTLKPTVAAQPAPQPQSDTSTHIPAIVEQPATPAVAKPAPVDVAKSGPSAIKIEDGKPINFAQNLKDYRSPKLAMLLSFLVPGLGQVYIGTKANYIKAAAYLVAEGGIIGAGFYFFDKATKQEQKAHAFADTTYSNTKMNIYADSLYSYLAHNKSDSLAKNIFSSIFGDSLPANWRTKFDSLYHSGKPLGGYYDAIATSPYVQGWKDCEPSIKDINDWYNSQIKSTSYNGTQTPGIIGNHFNYEIDTAVDPSNTFLVDAYDKATNTIIPSLSNIYGYSNYFNQYNTMLSNAHSYQKTGTYLLYAIVINHVISAVDALISAKAYNDDLLDKQSVWQKISVEPTTSVACVNQTLGLTMRIRF